MKKQIRLRLVTVLVLSAVLVAVFSACGARAKDDSVAATDLVDPAETSFWGDYRLEDCTLVVTYDALEPDTLRRIPYLSLYNLYNTSFHRDDIWRDTINGEQLKENADFIRLLKIMDFFGKDSFPPVPKQAADYPRTYAITAYYYLLGKDGKKSSML